MSTTVTTSSTTHESIHRPGQRIADCGFMPLMTGKLTKAGYTTWADIQQADYQALLKLKGVGGLMIKTLLDDLRAEGKHMKNAAHLNGLEGQELMTKIQEDKSQHYDRSGDSPFSHRKNAGAAGAALVGPRARRQEDLPYVEIIVQRGYRCRSCDELTIVEGEQEPRGMQFGGFTWNDGTQQGTGNAYFVCIGCATDVAIVGKVVLDIMTGEPKK